jgi:hypothetical protein
LLSPSFLHHRAISHIEDTLAMLSADFDIEEVLSKISIPDKIKLLGGNVRNA